MGQGGQIGLGKRGGIGGAGNTISYPVSWD